MVFYYNMNHFQANKTPQYSKPEHVNQFNGGS